MHDRATNDIYGYGYYTITKVPRPPMRHLTYIMHIYQLLPLMLTKFNLYKRLENPPDVQASAQFTVHYITTKF